MFSLYFKFFDNLTLSSKIIIQIICVFTLTFFISRLIKYVVFLFFKKLIKTNLENNIAISIKKLLLFLISIICFIVATDFAFIKIPKEILFRIIQLRFIIIYFLVLRFLIKAITQIKIYISNEMEFDMSTDLTIIEAFEKLSKIIVFLLWTIFAFGKLGFNLKALLAFSGAGGVMVGFAAKDLFANIFGGLMIYLDRPFNIGDWISSPDREIEGNVEFIGWRQTRILTFQKFPIYIPNSIFNSIIIQNISRIKATRIQSYIYIKTSDIDKVKTITSKVDDMLSKYPHINKKMTMLFVFDGYENGMIRLFLYVYTNIIKYSHFLEIKQDILLKVSEVIKECGVEIAIPPQDVHISNNSQPQDIDISQYKKMKKNS